MQALRTDRGGEFTSIEFKEYCESSGIKRYLTAPYSPQQNGVVERRNQTVIGMVRSMLKCKNLPMYFWAEAVKTAVYILNRSPTKSVIEATPYEKWRGRKPNVEHFRVFGSLAYARNTTPNLTKLQDRSVPMIFVGYETGSKAYRLYDPKAKRIHISRDVKFLEEEEYKWDVQQLEENKKEGGKFAVHYDPQVYVKDEDILEERVESLGTLLGDDSSPANDLSPRDNSSPGDDS